MDALYVRPLTTMVDCADADALCRYLTVLQTYRYHDGIFWLLDQPRGPGRPLGASVTTTLVDAYARSAPRPGLLRRTGRVPHLLRRARRGTSYGLERFTGRDGFVPAPTGWTHLYWPDS